MTITLNSEQERMIAEVVAAGIASDVTEAVDKAVRALHDASQAGARGLLAKNLSELLLNSPFAGADLDLERQRDYPRDLPL